MTKAKKGAKAAREGAGAPASVKAYLARVDGPAKGTFGKLRAAILSAAPKQATETISYRIPAVRHKGILVWFAAFRDHCSLFPTAAVVRQFKDELGAYKTSKGTIQFPAGKAPPAGLVRRIVKARVARVEAKGRR